MTPTTAAHAKAMGAAQKVSRGRSTRRDDRRRDAQEDYRRRPAPPGRQRTLQDQRQQEAAEDAVASATKTKIRVAFDEDDRTQTQTQFFPAACSTQSVGLAAAETVSKRQTRRGPTQKDGFF
jgi:hypothetical protein